MQVHEDVESKVREVFQAPPRKVGGVITPKDWKERYINYLMKHDVDLQDASDLYDELGFNSQYPVCDLTDSPEEVAQEDLDTNFE